MGTHRTHTLNKKKKEEKRSSNIRQAVIESKLNALHTFDITHFSKNGAKTPARVISKKKNLWVNFGFKENLIKKNIVKLRVRF